MIMNYKKLQQACERIEGVSIVLQESGCQCIVQSSADFSVEDEIERIATCYGCVFIRGSGNVRIHKIIPGRKVEPVKANVN